MLKKEIIHTNHLVIELVFITPFLKLYIKLFLPSNNSQNVSTLINRYFLKRLINRSLLNKYISFDLWRILLPYNGATIYGIRVPDVESNRMGCFCSVDKNDVLGRKWVLKCSLQIYFIQYNLSSLISVNYKDRLLLADF